MVYSVYIKQKTYVDNSNEYKNRFILNNILMSLTTHKQTFKNQF